MMKRMLAWLMLILLPLTALAEAPAAPESPAAETAEFAPAIEDAGLTLMGSEVRYPRVTGLGDPALEEAVNTLVQEACGVKGYLDRMTALISDPATITVTYEAALCGDVLSVTMEASGAVVNSRPTHVWTSANVDLTDGHAVAWEELFTRPEEASAALETYLEETVAPELSAHLASSRLTPLPGTFALSPTGLTLLYPVDQLSTLSDRAGAVTVLWSEIGDTLNLEDGGVLARIGAADNLCFPENAKEALTEALADGDFPGIPAKLNQPMPELIDRWNLLIDPDLYEGGRMVSLDGAAFRQAYLLTDALTETWEHSVVQGIRADRLNLLGLQTGKTTREAYLAALGEPDSSVKVDENRAEAWRIAPGTSDYYTLGEVRLRLHVDENGVLVSVFLTP